jgi:NTP pyrophosphatase (non-canonical NTP hydrolase)
MSDYRKLEANVLQELADRNGMAGGLQQLCEEAVMAWGIDAQIDMAIEECGELIVALNHYRRGRISSEQVLSEVADVSILVEQMASLFGRADFKVIRTAKVNKLATRLELKEQDDGFLRKLTKRVDAFRNARELLATDTGGGGDAKD